VRSFNRPPLKVKQFVMAVVVFVGQADEIGRAHV
jgi:hypothetical protein